MNRGQLRAEGEVAALANIHDARARAESLVLAILALILVPISVATMAWAAAGSWAPGTSLAVGVMAACAAQLRPVWKCGVRVVAGRLLPLLAVIVLSGLLAAAIHDFSSDGMTYQQQAILLLMDGFNPLRDAPAEGLWSPSTNGYPKGPWTWAAIVGSATGSIELGKMPSTLLCMAAFLMLQSTLRDGAGLQPRLASAGALLAAASPMVATQWPAFLNDGLLACLMTLLIAALWMLGHDGPALKRRTAAIAACALVLLAVTKTSGLVYAGLALVGFAVLGAARLGPRRAIARSWPLLLALVIGALTLGFNPYLTNWSRFGHPFYPLAGPHAIDMITTMSPNGIHSYGRLGKFLVSSFSTSHSDFDTGDQSLPEPAFRPKLPGSVKVSELVNFSRKNDTRIGGFGPLYGALLLLAVAGALLLARLAFRGNGAARWTLALLGLLMATVLVFPEPWWARYVPQAWLVPTVVGVALLSIATSGNVIPRPQSWLGGAILLTAAANLVIVWCAFAVGSVLREIDFHAHVASLAAVSRDEGPLPVLLGRTPSVSRRLDEAGVRWRAASEGETCAQWRRIELSAAQVCVTPQAAQKLVTESPVVTRLKRWLRGS